MGSVDIMKRKCGLRSVTLFLAICVSVFSASFCVLLMADAYHSARYKLDTHSQELQGWEACRQTKPAYYEANAEAVNTCRKSLEEAKDNFWVKLPKAQSIGLFVLAGLGSATGGFLATWAIVWFVGLGIYRFIRLLMFCFRVKLFRTGLHNKAEAIFDEANEPENYLEIAAEEQDKTHEEELEPQIEMLRDEVDSLREDIEKLSKIEVFTKGILKDDNKAKEAQDLL
jgi:hypothetical protein